MVQCLTCAKLQPLNFCGHYKRQIKRVDVHKQLKCDFYERRK